MDGPSYHIMIKLCNRFLCGALSKASVKSMMIKSVYLYKSVTSTPRLLMISFIRKLNQVRFARSLTPETMLTVKKYAVKGQLSVIMPMRVQRSGIDAIKYHT